MSLAEQYHNEHKARLARMGGNGYQPPMKPPQNYASLEAKFNNLSMAFNELRGQVAHLRQMISERQPEKPDAPTNRPSLKRIVSTVALHYGITIDEIMSGSKAQGAAFPRQVAMYLARTMTVRSYPEIAQFIGGRDHTTAIHGKRKVERMMEESNGIREAVESLRRQLVGS